ncbi:hypothetical protein ACFVVX_26770 [Kitasatospora sp. NPDC058170]|uniref:hypothetical protein n=1 Tax=Kitasatospora sp. NPDC058170 TaxID=3346364 RepID=UPI0036D86777
MLGALGALADQHESSAEFSADDGERMLTEICIRLDPDRARAAGHPHGLALLWNQVTGWLWAYGTSDDRLSDPQPLVLGLVATPDSITSAVEELLAGHAGHLPLRGEETSLPSPAALEALARAVAEGDLDEDTAGRLARYA